MAIPGAPGAPGGPVVVRRPSCPVGAGTTAGPVSYLPVSMKHKLLHPIHPAAASLIHSPDPAG